MGINEKEINHAKTQNSMSKVQETTEAPFEIIDLYSSDIPFESQSEKQENAYCFFIGGSFPSTTKVTDSDSTFSKNNTKSLFVIGIILAVSQFFKLISKY